MASPLEGLLVGRTLVGRYEVEGVLGRGGMSVVYRAIDKRLDRPVALKIVSFPSELADAERQMLRERLKREAASAAKLSPHPNVVQVYDYGTDADLDLDFIAMELLPGADLKEVLRDRTLSLSEGLAILDGAARGLAAGHRAGIVHRDVKPGNIFIAHAEEERGDGVVKILDFGIAKALDPGADDDLTHHAIPHSPAYASPEQLIEGGTLTPASDVYQLGLVAYEVLAGERPFTEADRERIRGGERVPLQVRGRWMEVPAEVRSVVEKSMAPQPADRWADARQFGDALANPGDLTRTVAAAAPAEVDDSQTMWMGASRPSPVRKHSVGGGKLVMAVFGASAVALIAWALMGGDSDPVGDVAAEPAVAEVEALHEEFRPLLFEAYETIRESVSEEEGEEAAATVQDVIYAMQQSWARGDVEEHVSYYASEVDFRGRSGTLASAIADERNELVERYDDREITVPQLAIEFIEPGLARALIDRTWRFDGDAESWEGSARDEMILRKTGDKWLVVEERELESFGETRDG